MTTTPSITEDYFSTERWVQDTPDSVLKKGESAPERCQFLLTRLAEMHRIAGNPVPPCSAPPEPGYRYCAVHQKRLRDGFAELLIRNKFPKAMARDFSDTKYPVQGKQVSSSDAPLPPAFTPSPPIAQVTPEKVSGPAPPMPTQGKAVFPDQEKSGPVKRPHGTGGYVHIPKKESDPALEREVGENAEMFGGGDDQPPAAPPLTGPRLRRFPLRELDIATTMALKQAALGSAVSLIKEIGGLEDTPYPRLIDQIRYLTIDFYRILAEENEDANLDEPATK